LSFQPRSARPSQWPNAATLNLEPKTLPGATKPIGEGGNLSSYICLNRWEYDLETVSVSAKS